MPIQEGFGSGAYRPGHGVAWPAVIREAKPTYTDDAITARIQGAVELEIVVLADGTVGSVHLTKSLDARRGQTGEPYSSDAMRANLQELRGASMVAPQVIRRVIPSYTSDAMRAKIQGQVDIEVIIRPDGTVGKARVVRSLDTVYGLDEQALIAARQWTFVPGTLDGKPVPVLVTITLEFKLRK